MRVLGLASALVLLSASLARATTWYVALSGNNSSGNSWANAYTNLQAAVNAAASGDTILLKQGHYYSTNVVRIISKSLTLSGGYLGESPEPGGFTDDPAATILDACATNRVLWLQNCVTGLLERLTLRNGRSLAGAGILATNSAATIRDCLIRDNTLYTSGRGAGLHLGGGTLNLIRCHIRGNTVNGTSYGGGLYQYGGSMSLDDCAVEDNTGNYRYAYGVGLYQFGGSLALRRCTLRNNTGASTGTGGALYQNGGDLDVDSCWITGNYVSEPGAALYVYASAGTRVFNSLVANNISGNSAVYVYNGASVTLANCTLAGNSPGAVERRAGTVVVSDSIVWNNGPDLVGAVSLNDSCIQNPDLTGPGVIHGDPGFYNGYRLPPGSPCLDAGSDTAAALGLDGAYTELETPDALAVDLGYHYPTSCAILNLYVSPAGTDDASHGTAPGPDAFRSLTYALGQARDDTRIHIEAGTYDASIETFPLNLTRHNLSLLGTNAQTTIVTADGAGASILRATNIVGCVLSNLTLRDANPPANVAGGAVHAFRSDMDLTDCILRDNCGLARYNHGAGLYMNGGSVDLLRCKIRNNRIASSTSGAGVFRVYGHLSVSDSILANNRSDSGSSGSGAALYSSGVGSARLENCLVANNSGYFTALQHGGGEMLLENVTVAHNAASGVRRTGGTVAISNSILWANGTDVTGLVALAFSCVGDTSRNGPGVRFDNPRFGPLYFLSDDSPCVDAGSDTAANLGLDTGYTQTGATDTADVDLGYHYPEAWQSATCYVSPLGTDDASHGAGPGDSAYRSITYALGEAADNTRIWIEAGLYDSTVETFPLLIEGRDGLQLLGTNADLTVLNATNLTAAVAVVSNALDCTLSNLTVTGGNSLTDGAGLALHQARVRITDADIRHNRIVNRNLAGGGGGLYQNGGHVNLLRCKVRNNTCTGTLQGGGLYARLGNLAIRETVICDNSVPASRVGGGLAASTMGFLQADHTLVVRNEADTRGGGLYTTAGTAVAFTNCTIANNRYGGYFCASPGARLWNSIAWGNGIELTGSVTVAYSCFGEAHNITDLGSNLRTYPTWADETHFHLQSTLGQYEGGFFAGGEFTGGPGISPLLDAGDPASDYRREPRPCHGIEMGAYGNTPTASLTPVIGFMLTVH